MDDAKSLCSSCVFPQGLPCKIFRAASTLHVHARFCKAAGCILHAGLSDANCVWEGCCCTACGAQVSQSLKMKCSPELVQYKLCVEAPCAHPCPRHVRAESFQHGVLLTILDCCGLSQVARRYQYDTPTTLGCMTGWP